MLGTTFIDFLTSNSTSVPVINALYTYGLSLLIHCWIQFADILFKGYSCSVLKCIYHVFFSFCVCFFPCSAFSWAASQWACGSSSPLCTALTSTAQSLPQRLRVWEALPPQARFHCPLFLFPPKNVFHCVLSSGPLFPPRGNRAVENGLSIETHIYMCPTSYL